MIVIIGIDQKISIGRIKINNAMATIKIIIVKTIAKPDISEFFLVRFLVIRYPPSN